MEVGKQKDLREAGRRKEMEEERKGGAEGGGRKKGMIEIRGWHRFSQNFHCHSNSLYFIFQHL
jgi:hypothetical protein